MGGGGSSSGGWTGGGGSVTVLNSSDLISQREGKQSEVDQTLQVLRDVQKQYGVNVDTEVGTLKQANVMAYYGGGSVGVNKTYFDAKKMDSAYDACVQQGWHPSRGNKTGMEATVAHEMGHALTDAAAQSTGVSLDKTASQIIKDAKKQAGYRRGAEMAGKISGYAKTNPAEAVAEAYADVYCNGSKAKKESKAIVDTLNKYVRR